MQTSVIGKCCFLLGLLGTACASPQYMAHLKGVQTGPYHVYNCGSHTPAFSSLIDTLITTIQKALTDLSGPTSSAAYTAFFKNIVFAPEVYDILSSIAGGVPISPGPYAILNAMPDLFGSPVTPQFVCVTDFKQLLWSSEPGGRGGKQVDAFTACQQSPVNAFAILGSKYLSNPVVICPSFWHYIAIPPMSKAACLTVDPHFNRFRDNGARLVNYQLWVVLHELVHFYVYSRSGVLSELSNPSDCSSLSPSSAVHNAQNYVYYMANLRLGCRAFPSQRRPSYGGTVPFNVNGIELLEIDANTTLVGSSKSQNVSVDGGGPIGQNSTRTSSDPPDIVAPAPWPT